MHLRLSRFVALAPERIDAMVAEFRGSDYVDKLSEFAGFEGYLLAVDYGKGKLTAMSLWHSLPDLEASDQFAEAARVARIAASRPARHPFVDRYEIRIRRGMEQFEGHLRLSRLEGVAPDAVEALVGAFEQSDYLDQLGELSGFAGYLLAAHADDGKITAMSMWDTHNDLLASDRLAEAAREVRIIAAQSSHDPIVDRSEIVLSRQPV